MSMLLKSINLTKEYQSGKGAIGIDLEISKGEIIGFLGPNGAGKTTTIKMLMGLLKQDSGELEIFGKKLQSFADFEDLYKKIGFLPSEPAYYDSLTARQMFEYASQIREIKSEIIEKYSHKLKLDLDKKISKLSLGNKRKIGVMLSIIDNPDLLIMDEPTSGLDPLIQREVLEILKERAKLGTGILISSHNLSEIESICDRIIVIKDAQIIFSGTIKDIKQRKQKKVEFIVKDKMQLDRILSTLESTEVRLDKTLATVYTSNLIQITKSLIEEKIEDFTIENPTLEEMFIDYYK